MSNLESSSLAGSAPSEQELLETLAEAIGEFERLAAEEPAKFRPANLLTAHQLRWLASALPGLLATARDGERLDWLEANRRNVFPPSQNFQAWTVEGGRDCASLREAIDDRMPSAESAAARSTGSVDNG